MSTSTTSRERPLQSFTPSNGGSSHGKARSPPSSAERSPYSDASFELNSHGSLPHDWEQCLNIKTGEIFYVDWRNREMANSDPRRGVNVEVYRQEDVYSDADSDESMSESSICSSAATGGRNKHAGEEDGVLVVAGCRICFMYIMVPKQDLCCPKCHGRLLHFER